MHVNMNIMKRAWYAAAVALSTLTWTPREVLAGPNIMAIGNYRALPFKRAEGRDSFSGKEVVFSFSDPKFDFGRVVVRSNQPTSVVRRDFFVGYSGSDLRVSTRAGGQGANSVSIQEVEIWLKIKGQLRPETTYEWEIEAGIAREGGLDSLPAVIPAFWADGQPIGVDVNIVQPVQQETDRIRRMQFPHGLVKTPSFENQTGASWVVLKPRSFGDFFAVARFSFREVDSPDTVDAANTMPIPVRYVPIRNEVEDQIAEVLERSSEVLRRGQSPEGFWGAGNDLNANVDLTAMIAGALGEINARDEKVVLALKWLSEQELPQGQTFAIQTIINRLVALARFGEPMQYGATLQADALFLAEAQLDDGGWGDRSPKTPSQSGSVIVSNHDYSIGVLRALIEARYAGAEVDTRVFRNAMRYWSDAQGADGGFTTRLARYGSISQPTVAYTATGTAGLALSLDMASGFGAKKCSLYLGSKDQLRGMDAGIRWLNEVYKADFRSFGGFGGATDAYIEPERLLILGHASGLTHLNNKNHFVESAEALLTHFDPTTLMFGVRGQGGGRGLVGQAGAFAIPPSPMRTAWALSILGAGNAPTVLQRIVAGDDEHGWAQYRGDAAHVVKYLARREGMVLNWRRSDIDRDVADLAEAPLLLLSVVGPVAWTDSQWGRIREYCLAGGTVIVDIGDEADAQRPAVLSAIGKAFPEYSIVDLPADAGVFAVNKEHKPIAGIKSLRNGFRDFLFIPPKSWSCSWHNYDLKQSVESFHFMEDLLKYATDETPPRSSFARSTYAAPAASSRSMKAARIQVGSDIPAYPNLIDTMSRLMQSNYRTRIDETKPSDADMIWVNVAGLMAPSEDVRQQLRDAIRNGKPIFADVVSGNVDWDESFRAVLKSLEPGITLQELRRNDPVFTGEIPGTQGFDVTNVAFRKALHDRFSQSGRCDLHGIYLNGRRVGVYSAYDISSGIGYHYFPGCRGIEPDGARQLAMNMFLAVYGKKVNPESRADGR